MALERCEGGRGEAPGQHLGQPVTLKLHRHIVMPQAQNCISEGRKMLARFLAEIRSRLFGLVYLLMIPAFTGIYQTLANEFFHNTA